MLSSKRLVEAGNRNAMPLITSSIFPTPMRLTCLLKSTPFDMMFFAKV